MENIPLRKKKYAQEDLFLNALAEAYRLQESIIGATELSIISISTEGKITSFNRAAETLTGYSAEDMIGRHTPMVLHDSLEVIERAGELSLEMGFDIEPTIEVFTTIARVKRIPDRKEWTYIRKDGTRFPVLLSISGIWNDKDQLIGYAGIATDISDLKAAAKKLKESEAHLQALLNSIDDIALEISKDGVYTNVWTKNDHLLFVTPREEYVGKRLTDVLSGELLVLYQTTIAKVLRTQQPEYIEYLTPDGLRWSSGKISFIHHDKVLMLVRNITEKKKAELLLLQSEQKFRALAENIPGAIYLRRNDAAQSLVYLNDGIEGITGYPASDFFEGKVNFSHLCHPEDREYVAREITNGLASGKKFHLKYRIRHADTAWRWIDEVGVGLQNNDDSLVEGFISDVTLQKQAEEALQKVAEENYRLFNTSVTLNVIAGLDGFFKRINPAWTQRLGWTEQELTEKPFLDFVHPEDVAATKDTRFFIGDGSDMLSFENRFRCKDGTYRWLLWSAAADLKNELIYASAVDITERKKSEDSLLRSKQNTEAIASKLQEQNRQLDEFAHIISHNLRSPIGNIKALIGLLDGNSTVADYQQIFEKLKNVANNLGETMNELMETLKVKKDTSIDRLELRFKDIFDKVVQSLEGDLIQCGAHITFDFSEAPVINYSKTYLESIFQNLLSNAIKYRSPQRSPRVHAQTSVLDNSVVLRVKDNGVGIDMEKYGDKLFGLHKTFHEHKDARGVGLFLVKTQIDALGGSILAESKPDQGTTFIVRF